MSVLKVSLYIPCFNAAQTIRHCLEAVLKQSYPLEEVIVIDDGSTDETARIVSAYPVRLIRHTHNQGLATARNTAIKNIGTEFIAALDADCLPEADWLVQLMKRFSSPKIAGVGGKLLESYSNNVFDFWRAVHMRQHWEDEDRLPRFLFGSNTVFRKEALLAVGLYNEEFKNNYEDVDICQRLKKDGWFLIYEPKAIVHHLKKDDICSILENYWRWNIAYYQKKNFYDNSRNFVFKLKDNLGLANRYIEEDLAAKRHQLLYLDFLLALHHSLKDFEYFTYKNKQGYSDCLLLSLWLALIDLTFFYHFDSGKDQLPTLIPKKNSLLQNFFALNLILGSCISGIFKSKDFKRILYKHLLLSLYKTDDNYLLDRLLNLIELHKDWSNLLRKKQPNINILFLKSLYLYLQRWLKDLTLRFPDIVRMIEISAGKTDKISP
ncbi:MAG: glycosyltransferase family 2 protein [Candidatus Omnitrophica bacterium]|nr:glycosyltransferase family 2 protein [Candidatus Omnitrophota bacterium]